MIFKHVKFCMEKAKGIGSVRGEEAKNGDQGVEDFDYYYYYVLIITRRLVGGKNMWWV